MKLKPGSNTDVPLYDMKVVGADGKSFSPVLSQNLAGEADLGLPEDLDENMDEAEYAANYEKTPNQTKTESSFNCDDCDNESESVS